MCEYIYTCAKYIYFIYTYLYAYIIIFNNLTRNKEINFRFKVKVANLFQILREQDYKFNNM